MSEEPKTRRVWIREMLKYVLTSNEMLDHVRTVLGVRPIVDTLDSLIDSVESKLIEHVGPPPFLPVVSEKAPITMKHWVSNLLEAARRFSADQGRWSSDDDAAIIELAGKPFIGIGETFGVVHDVPVDPEWIGNAAVALAGRLNELKFRPEFNDQWASVLVDVIGRVGMPVRAMPLERPDGDPAPDLPPRPTSARIWSIMEMQDEPSCQHPEEVKDLCTEIDHLTDENERLRFWFERRTPWLNTTKPLDADQLVALQQRWATGPEKYQADADALIVTILDQRVELGGLRGVYEAMVVDRDRWMERSNGWAEQIETAIEIVRSSLDTDDEMTLPIAVRRLEAALANMAMLSATAHADLQKERLRMREATQKLVEVLGADGPVDLEHVVDVMIAEHASARDELVVSRKARRNARLATLSERERYAAIADAARSLSRERERYAAIADAARSLSRELWLVEKGECIYAASECYDRLKALDAAFALPTVLAPAEPKAPFKHGDIVRLSDGVEGIVTAEPDSMHANTIRVACEDGTLRDWDVAHAEFLRHGPAGAPLPMYLTCPKCNARHIDEGEHATKVHHTHSCQSCGLTWRPAIVPTVGVAFLPGFKNEHLAVPAGIALIAAERAVVDAAMRIDEPDGCPRAVFQRARDALLAERAASREVGIRFGPAAVAEASEAMAQDIYGPGLDAARAVVRAEGGPPVTPVSDGEPSERDLRIAVGGFSAPDRGRETLENIVRDVDRNPDRYR